MRLQLICPTLLFVVRSALVVADALDAPKRRTDPPYVTVCCAFGLVMADALTAYPPYE